MKRIAQVLTLAVLAVTGFVIAVPGTVSGFVDTVTTNDGVCDNLDTGHLSAGNATSTTIYAPAGMVIVKVCVKAGSANQGNGPEYTDYDPGVASVTISHSSGKEISHYSVEYAPKDETETTTTTTDTTDTTTTTETTTTTDTETEPPTTTTETTPPPRCSEGTGPYGGKDGNESDPYHNQECCPDRNNDQICDATQGPPPVTGTTPDPQPPTTTPLPTTPSPPVTSIPEPPSSSPPPESSATSKPPKTKPPKKPAGVPKKAPPVCRPGQVETKVCGVQGSG